MLLGVHDDDELERLLLSQSRKLRAILDAADRRIDEGAGMGHDEFGQKVYDLLQFSLAGRGIKIRQIWHYSYAARWGKVDEFKMRLRKMLEQWRLTK